MSKCKSGIKVSGLPSGQRQSFQQSSLQTASASPNITPSNHAKSELPVHYSCCVPGGLVQVKPGITGLMTGTSLLQTSFSPQWQHLNLLCSSDWQAIQFVTSHFSLSSKKSSPLAPLIFCGLLFLLIQVIPNQDHFAVMGPSHLCPTETSFTGQIETLIPPSSLSSFPLQTTLEQFESIKNLLFHATVLLDTILWQT